MLTLGDLNLIIKYYAYQIQQRIEELEHLSYNFAQPEQAEDSQEYQFIAVVSKYHLYGTRDEKEVKLAKKLVERIMQIYQFFKIKSSSQNLLALIQQKIQSELNQIIAQIPINLGELFSYIHLITKRGCVVKVPAEKRRTLSKSVIRQTNKIQGKMIPTLSLFNIQRRGTHHAVANKAALVYAKSTTTSIVCEKWKIQDVVNGIWQGLEIDRGHLMRIRDGNQNLMVKEMMRRNQKIGAAMKQYERRVRKTMTEVSQEQKQSTILSQVKINMIKGMWGSKKRRPLMSRKRNTILKQNISTLT